MIPEALTRGLWSQVGQNPSSNDIGAGGHELTSKQKDREEGTQARTQRGKAVGHPEDKCPVGRASLGSGWQPLRLQ